MPAKTLKAADKHTIVKKLVAEMKRRYGGSTPKDHRTSFETLLFAACLEDVNQAEAEAAYARLLESFFDLNEIRVSSVTEIQSALGDVHDAAWKAMRMREALQYVFEKHYAFDLEFLKRKTQEAAVKELASIPYQTSFIKNYVIQHVLGAHVLPVDQSLHHLLIWLGLAGPESKADVAGEELKPAVKKSDDLLVCHLFRCTATDPQLREHFADAADEGADVDPFAAPQRLVELFKNPRKKKKKPKPAPAGKAVSRKKPEKKTPARSQQKTKPSGKTAVKKVTKRVPPPAKSHRKSK